MDNLKKTCIVNGVKRIFDNGFDQYKIDGDFYEFSKVVKQCSKMVGINPLEECNLHTKKCLEKFVKIND